MTKIVLDAPIEKVFNKYPITVKNTVFTTSPECYCLNNHILEANYCFNCGRRFTTTSHEVYVLNKDSIYNWSTHTNNFTNKFDLNNINKNILDICKMTSVLYNTDYACIKNGYVYALDPNFPTNIMICKHLGITNIDTITKEYNIFKDYFGDLGDITII